MKTFTSYIICTFALLILLQIEASACSCKIPVFGETLKKQVKDEIDESAAIFSATVLKVTEKRENDYVAVEIKIIKVWKGNLSQKVTILTGRDDGDCGFRFKVGTNYLVYAHQSSDDLSKLATSICTRTKRFTEAKAEIKLLDKNKHLWF